MISWEWEMIIFDYREKWNNWFFNYIGEKDMVVCIFYVIKF